MSETRKPRADDRPTRRATTTRDLLAVTDGRPLARHAAGLSAAQKRRRIAVVIAAAAGGPLTVIALVSLLAVGAFAWQVLQVRDDLQGAMEESKQMVRAAARGDIGEVQRSGTDVVARAQRAHDTTRGPLWDLAAQIPAARNNVLAVRAVTDIAHTLTSQTLPPVLTMMSVSSEGTDAQRINLKPFLNAGSVIPTVLTSFDEATQIAAAMDRTDVLPQISAPVDDLVTLLAQATPVLQTVEEHLPALLRAAGAERPMLYQLMIQTPAEIRATGGGVAQWLVLQVDGGKVDLLSQDTGTALMYEDLPARGFDTENGSLVDLPSETRELYPREFTSWSSNFTMTPDFPTSVELFQATREWTDKPTFDGAFSIDPVVLAHLLEATGPLTLTSGEVVDAGNAASVLMSEPYERFGMDNGAMDAYFNEVSSGMFAKLTSSQWDIAAMWDQVVRSAQEGRIYAWFDDTALQELSHQYGLDGALPENNADATQLGIYFNDYSIGKLEYHLTYSQRASCDAENRTMTVAMDLRNGITDAIKSGYTLGLRNLERGIDPRTMMLDVLFFAPPGGEILTIAPVEGDWWDPRFHDRSGADAPVEGDWWDPRFHDRSGADHDNPAESRAMLLAEGESRTVSYTVQLPDGELGPLQLRHTPGAHDTEVTIDANCAPLFRSPEGSDNVMLSTIG